jgi:KAP family P-loop domain.
MVGIVDQALEVGGSDDLDISAYHEAVVDFIKKTDTPMTIGVQGEWGSGKTSLLNQIWSKLEEYNQEHQDDENFGTDMR